ncbi:hypothetical protein ACIPSE_34215 [Streptomyces sp. NPDC090106]|uniref:hypothetical protein n=1 Tax=Streptomyces sp. NPDC090106 TaxID=3365946 RepID=UPI003810B984
MSAPSASDAITIRLGVPAEGSVVSQLSSALAALGSAVTALDVVSCDSDRLDIDVTLSAASTSHADEIVGELHGIEGVTIGVDNVLADTLPVSSP